MSANRTRLTYYQDKKGLWRWRLTYGRFIVADSGQGYTRKDSCKQGWERVEDTCITRGGVEVVES